LLSNLEHYKTEIGSEKTFITKRFFFFGKNFTFLKK